MFKSDFFTCDICQKPREGKESVRNEVYVENGEHTGNYPQVCDSCVRKIGEVIKELKPKE